jgi:hypothetical protein
LESNNSSSFYCSSCFSLQVRTRTSLAGFSFQSGLNIRVSATIWGLTAKCPIFFCTLQPQIIEQVVPPKPDQSEMPIFFKLAEAGAGLY